MLKNEVERLSQPIESKNWTSFIFNTSYANSIVDNLQNLDKDDM